MQVSARIPVSLAKCFSPLLNEWAGGFPALKDPDGRIFGPRWRISTLALLSNKNGALDDHLAWQGGQYVAHNAVQAAYLASGTR